MREAEFAPAPAGEGALADEGQDVVPEDDAAVGGDGGGLQAVEHAGAGGDRVASVTAAGQVRQQPMKCSIQGDRAEQDPRCRKTETLALRASWRSAALPPGRDGGDAGDRQQLQQARAGH
ncbi:hypothetical protein D9M68_969900 [compost metagenome]